MTPRHTDRHEYPTFPILALIASVGLSGYRLHDLTLLSNQVQIFQGTITRSFLARPTAKTGIYRARVVFPRAGMWRWQIWDGFSRTHTYRQVKVTRALT